MRVFELTSLGSEAPLNARGPTLAKLGDRSLIISRFSRHPKWEIHPRDDELLLVIDGEIEITLLLKSERPRNVLGPGMACIVPKGVWHSPVPLGTVTLLSMADYRGTRASDAADPSAVQPRVS